jgi:hypothetical protein
MTQLSHCLPLVRRVDCVKEKTSTRFHITFHKEVLMRPLTDAPWKINQLQFSNDRTSMKTTIILLILMPCVLAPQTFSQWTQTSGPEGGFPMSFVSLGATMYAGSFAGGVFKSTNSGDLWVWSGAGLPNAPQVRSLATDGTNLYAGTSAGVYKSIDAGSTWTVANSGLSSTNVNAVYVFGSSLFAGTASAGSFVSTNQGANWTIDTVGLSSLAVRCFGSSGSFIFAGTGGGVFRSTNNGATWAVANSGLTNTNVNTIALVNGVLLAGTQSGGVFRSTDNGNSWTGGGIDITLALAVIGNDVFQATLGGIMRSTDFGVTWNSANAGIPPTNNTRSLGVLGTALFVGMGNNGDKGGVYRSTNLGANWVEKNTGYINTQVLTFLKPNANTIFAGNADGGLYTTTNNGTTWTLIRNFGTGVTSIYSGPSFMFLGVGSSTGSVHRSSDNGTTWVFSGVGLPTSGTITGIVEIGGFTVVSSSSGGIYRSTNSGTNWAASNSGLTNTAVNAMTTFGAFTYAGTSGGFFISSNSGGTWTISNAGLTSTNVQCMFSPATSIIYVGTSNGGVFVSTNNGANWSAANSGLTSLAVRALVAQGANVFAGTAGGVFVSRNSGATWTVANTGLNNISIQSLNLDIRDFLFAGTLGNGAWRRPYVELTDVKEIGGIVPTRFVLEQNYPNPFNPSTRIRFSIADRNEREGENGRRGEGASVTLKVFDVLGREVATLVNENLSAGSYETTFDATFLSSGVYVYRMQAGDFSASRRMIVVK